MNRLLCQINSTKAGQTLFRESVSDNDLESWWPYDFITFGVAQRCLSMPPDAMAHDSFCRDFTLAFNSSMVSYARGLFSDPLARARNETHRLRLSVEARWAGKAGMFDAEST